MQGQPGGTALRVNCAFMPLVHADFAKSIFERSRSDGDHPLRPELNEYNDEDEQEYLRHADIDEDLY